MFKNSITHKKKVIEIPDTHALLSASLAHRWLKCPPSAKLNRIMPERPTEASNLGRRAHDIAEKILKGELQSTGDPNVNYYVDYVRKMVKTIEGNLHIEVQLDYSHIAPEGFGTSDAVIVGEDNLHIIDFKNGAYPVDPIKNYQLVLYLSGAVKKFDFKGEALWATIVQPKSKEKIKTWGLTVTELKKYEEQIKPIAEIAFLGKGNFNAGDHCSMCRFKEKCPEYEEHFNKIYGF